MQPYVTPDKSHNLKNITKLIEKAVKTYNPRIVTLPEFFNSPYKLECMKENAEPIPNGVSCQTLSKLAKDLKIYIVGGSIPEIDSINVYNTTTVWSPDGELIAKHRKVIFLFKKKTGKA